MIRNSQQHTFIHYDKQALNEKGLGMPNL